MKLVEFRLAMPLTLEEYKLCQLYLVAKASLEDSEKNLNSLEKNENESKKNIVILKNESYINENGSSGQYTYKRINLLNKLPKWLLNFIDSKYCILDEKSWNSYPYLKTVYESSGFPKAKIQVESAHYLGFNTEDNALNIPEDLLPLRKVIFIDIVNDKLSYKDYNPKEDPSLFYSEKAKRGKLDEKWKENSTTIMTCYKLFTINIPYFGIFCSRIENWIISSLKDNILKYHRKAFCWIDEWFDLTIEDIRNIEKEVQIKLDRFWNESETNNLDQAHTNNDEGKSSKEQDYATIINSVNQEKIDEDDNSKNINKNNIEHLNNKQSIINTCEKTNILNSPITNAAINNNKNNVEKLCSAHSLKKDSHTKLHNFNENKNSFVNDKNTTLHNGNIKIENETKNEKELVMPASHLVNKDNDNLDTDIKNIDENKKEKKKKKEKDYYRNASHNKANKNELMRCSEDDRKSSSNENITSKGSVCSLKTSLKVNILNENNINLDHVIEKVNNTKKKEENKNEDESESFFFFKKNSDNNEFGEYLYRLNDGMFYSWKLRYFVIKNSKLCYYLNDKKSELKGEIDLLNAQIQWIGEHKGRNSVFVVNSYNKNVVYLSSEDEIQTKRCMIDIQMAALLNSKNSKNEMEEDKANKKKLSNIQSCDFSIKQNIAVEDVNMQHKKKIHEQKRNEKSDFKNEDILNSKNMNDQNIINETIYNENKNNENFCNNNYLNEENNKNKNANKKKSIDKSIKNNNMHNNKLNDKNFVLIKDDKDNDMKRNNIISKEGEYIFNKKVIKNEIENSLNINRNYNPCIDKDSSSNNNNNSNSSNINNQSFNLYTKNNNYKIDKISDIHDNDIKKKNMPSFNKEGVNIKRKILNEIKNKISHFSNYKNIETIKLNNNIISNDATSLLNALNININEVNLNALQDLTDHIKNLSIYEMNSKNKNIDLFYFLFNIFSIFSCFYSFITLYIYFKFIFYFLFFFFFCVFMFFYNENIPPSNHNNIYRCSVSIPVNINYLMKILTSENKYHLGEFNKKLFKTKKTNFNYVFSSFNIYFHNFFLNMFSYFFKKRNAFYSQYTCECTNNNMYNKQNENTRSYIFIQYTNKNAKIFFKMLNLNEEIYNRNYPWNSKTLHSLDKKNNNIYKRKAEEDIKNRMISANKEYNLRHEKLSTNKRCSESIHNSNNNNNSLNNLNNEINNGSNLMKNKSCSINEYHNETINFYDNKKNINTFSVKKMNLFIYWIVLKLKFLFKYLKKRIYSKYVDIEGFDIFLIKEKEQNLCEINYFTCYNYKSYIFNSLLNFSRCLHINSLSFSNISSIFNFENLREDRECKGNYSKDEEDMIIHVDKKKIEKEISKKIFFSMNNKNNSKSIIHYLYDLTYSAYFNRNYLSLIKNVDDVFFIINLSKTFLYVIEHIRLYKVKQANIMNECLNNSENNLDYSDDLFILNVILLLKSLNLLHYTFSNSFILSKKNENLECSFGHSNINIKMRNSIPLAFFLIAENIKSKAKIISDLNLTTFCSFDEIKIIIENEIQIKNKSNYQISLKYPNILIKNIMHGHMCFYFSDELIIKDSLRNFANIKFIDKSKCNGKFFGVIKRNETITDILRGNIFDKIILNNDKEFSGMEGIQINITHKQNIKNSTTLSLDYLKLSHIIEEKCKKSTSI